MARPWRPPSEWVITEEPLMRDFLGDETLRAMAVEAQRKYWQHIADPDRPKLSKSKHKASDYLLSGLLHAKQDGGALVGVLCGRVGHKVRYYRHRRGRTGYIKGSIYNNLIHAETVEKAVIEAVKSTLSETEHLRQRLLEHIAAHAHANTAVDVDALMAERERLKKRMQLIITTFDESTLAEVREEIEKLKSQRRQLDEQIAAAASAQKQAVDAEALADAILRKIENFFGAMDTMPKHLVKEWLAVIVSKVVVDMQTKAIEIHVALPTAMLKSAFPSENPMRLVTTSASPTGYETHPHAALLALVDCELQTASNHICYRCRRAAA